MATRDTQEWLSACLRKNPDSFDALYECHTFCAKISTQIGDGRPPRSNSSSPAPRGQRNVQRQWMQSEREVHSYLDESDLDNFDIIVVAFAKPPQAYSERFPLPISPELFDKVSQALDISPALLAVVNTGVVSFFVSPSEQNGASAQEKLIIQQTRSVSHFSMGVTISDANKTRILIFGAQAWSISELFDYLESADLTSENNSISIPVSVLALQARWFTGTINSLRHRVGTIEDTTGMRKPISHQALEQPVENWKDLDLVPITGELSSLLSRFSFLKMQTDNALYLIQQLRQYAETLTDRSVGSPGFQRYHDRSDLFSKLENARGWYQGLMAQCEYLVHRTSAQIQTVYSLLSSQNSIVNIDIARASNVMAELSRSDNQAMLHLSELSRRDAQLMIDIARDSRSVALSTARDSASMRVIAAVTVLFLPATFTATFFSMTFFNFLEAEKPKASPWIWVYVVSTGLLTVIIQIIWAFLSHQSQSKLLSGSQSHLKAMQDESLT